MEVDTISNLIQDGQISKALNIIVSNLTNDAHLGSFLRQVFNDLVDAGYCEYTVTEDKKKDFEL